MMLDDARPTNWLYMTCERLSEVLYRLHFVSVAPPTYLTTMMQRTARTKVTTSHLADTDDDNAIKFNDLQCTGQSTVIKSIAL